MTETWHPPSDPSRTRRRTGRTGAVLWFAVLGGIVAWAVHLLVAWSFMEVGCLAPGRTTILQRADGPGAVATWVAYVATAGPWLAAFVALVTCLRLRRRLRRDAGAEDELVTGRSELLLVIGVLLDLMALAAITGSAVGLVVLEPCA